MSVKTITALAAVCLLSLSARALDAPSADAIAQAVIADLGHTKGVCALPRSGDGQLALAFVQRSAMQIHAVAANQATAAAIRGTLEPTGQSGNRVYVDFSALAVFPYADRFVDCVVVTNLTGADLDATLLAEVRRSLCPGGRAWIGRAASEGAGLTQSALTTWLGSTPGATVRSDAIGVFAVITGQQLAGTSEWTHRQHDPGNGWGTPDVAAKWPFLPQTYLKPYSSSRQGGWVCEGGRAYASFNWDWQGSGSLRTLQAYRIYNGQPLWSRNLNADWPGSIAYNVGAADPVMMSLVVAYQGVCYMAKENCVLRLDGETGARLDSITLDASGRRVKWMAIDGGRLYALTDANTSWAAQGDKLVGMDLANNSVLWTYAAAAVISVNSAMRHPDIGAAGGNVYFRCGGNLVALNGADRSQLWSVAAAGEQLVCTPYAVLAPISGGITAFSPATGAQEWQRATGKWWVADTLLFTEGDNASGAISVKSNIANAAYRTPTWSNGGCGWPTVSLDGVYSQAGGMAYSFSRSQRLPTIPLKSDCQTPPFVSNGLFTSPVNSCICMTNRGSNVFAPAGSFVFDQDAVGSQRLDQGPAYSLVVRTVNPDAQDWPTHRANIERKGSSPLPVAASPHFMWKASAVFPYPITQVRDSVDREPTPSVTAGDFVYWAGTDGYVRCWDGSRIAWSYGTGGPVYATPTVYDGCVYVGSGDGGVYCLEAHTGRLVWRFRGAPAGRVFSLFGKLASTWPVFSGVLCKDGKVYFAAGYNDGFGAHVYALDARTGAIVWQNNRVGSAYDQAGRRGVSPSGYMTIVGNNLWLRGYEGDNALLNLGTGAMAAKPTISGGSPVRGREIGVIDAQHVLYGGRSIFQDFTDGGFHGMSFHFMNLTPGSDRQYPEMWFMNNSAGSVTPAWDSDSFFTTQEVTNRDGNLECWDIPRLTSEINRVRAANASSSSTLIGPDDWAAVQDNPMMVWRVPTINLTAVVVAPNAIVITRFTRSGSLPTWTWDLEGRSRATGAVLWTIALPGPAQHQGLAINHNGDIVVTMRNGDVMCYGSGAAVSCLTPFPPSPPGEGGYALPRLAAARSAPQPQAPHAAAGLATQPVYLTPSLVLPSWVDPQAAATVGPRQSQALATLVTRTQEQAYQPTDTRWQPRQPCLAVDNVVASSSARAMGPANTIDRSLTSRWTPARGGRQWLVYDLGACREVSAVTVVWFSLRQSRTAFSIELSADGTRFDEVDGGVLAGRGTSTALRSFVTRQARYVRVCLDVAQGAAAPSVYEVGVHGAVVASCGK